jgi:hypothetical protein
MNRFRLVRLEGIPVNMISLSFPFPVLTKNNFSCPSLSVLVILNVEANPLPPCEAMVVDAASSERALTIAGSNFGAM